MPQMDGIELCRQLRSIAQMPIIVLSVFDNDRMKREAREAGADDYLTKPFNLKELQARIRAKLRRRLTLGSDSKRSLVTGDFKIEVADRLVTVRGSSVRLDLKQFELLLYLAEHANQVCTHRALLYAIGGSDADHPDYVHMYVAQLRRQIETSDEPRYLVTERSTGYRFRPYGNAV
jgi:two-component system KDP operon response regulator KdpE